MPLLSGVPPSDALHVTARCGAPGISLRLEVGKTFAQVELRLDHADRSRNGEVFQHLHACRAEVEAAFGAQLNWPARKASTVAIARTEMA